MTRHYRTTTHSKYDLKVHIVFIPKYRKRFLYGQIGEVARDLIRQICTEIDVEIIAGKIAIDHVHLFVSHPPHLSVSKLVQNIKGKSSYKLFSAFPTLRNAFWGRHLWTRGYLAVSSGNITDEAVRAYIEQQEGVEINQQGNISLQA